MICDDCKDKLYCGSYGVEHDSYLCLALTGRLGSKNLPEPLGDIEEGKLDSIMDRILELLVEHDLLYISKAEEDFWCVGVREGVNLQPYTIAFLGDVRNLLENIQTAKKHENPSKKEKEEE